MNSTLLWVDLPRIPALRSFVEQHAA